METLPKWKYIRIIYLHFQTVKMYERFLYNVKKGS